MLEAGPPPGQELTQDDLDRSVEIMRNRVDKLGVSEPEIRKQGDDQIVDRARRRRRPGARPPRSSAQTAQLAVLRPRGRRSPPPSISDVRRRPDRATSSTRCSRQRPGPGRERRRPSVLPRTPRTKRLRRRPGGRRRRRSSRRSSSGEAPEGSRVPRRARSDMIVLTCGPTRSRVVCPRRRRVGAAQRPTTTSSSTSRPTTQTRSRADRERPRSSTGTRQDFDRDRAADRAARVHGRGRGQVPRDHARARRARRAQAQTGHGTGRTPFASTSRSSSTARSVRRRSSTSRPEPATGSRAAAPRSPGLDSIQEAKDLALVLQTGALPRQVRAGRPHRRLGDARQGLAQRGDDRRRSAACSLVALFLLALLPLPRASSRSSGSLIYAALPLRRDPALQRHADPARASPA